MSMKRRRLLAACGVTVVALAGCGSSTESGSETASIPPETSTRTPTPTEIRNVPEAEIVGYEKLSPEQQAAFDRARTEVVVFSSSLPEHAERNVDFGIEVSLPFRNHEYVRKDGTLYEIQLAGPTRVPATRIEVRSVDSTANETAIRLANRSGEGYELVERAIEGDGIAKGIEVAQPDAVSTGDFVEYRDTHYEITHLSHRDYAYFEMTIEKHP